jgi:pantoate--beta-alanine ligase
VIESLVRDLDLDVSIKRLPIVREPQGLAKSSRNLYLSKEETEPSLSLSRALDAARQRVLNGESSAQKIRQEIREQIEKYDKAEIDYISVCDPESFIEQEEIKGSSLIALAVRIGKTRLIDNCIVGRVKCSE